MSRGRGGYPWTRRNASLGWMSPGTVRGGGRPGPLTPTALRLGVQPGLRPVRQLAARAAAIDVQHLHLRLDQFRELSELSALSQALNQMLSRLEAGFAQLSRFSEDLAHEMRTPLSNLMGQTQQALGRVRSAEEYQNLLASNQEEYERLARMIDSMLLLARTEQRSSARPSTCNCWSRRSATTSKAWARSAASR